MFAKLVGKNVVPVKEIDESDSYVLIKDSLNGFFIHTSFTGVDAGVKDTPLWFVTTVTPHGSFDPVYTRRYETYFQAELGHEMIVFDILAGTDPKELL